MKTEIVMATPEIFDKFYGKQPEQTVRAVAAVRGDKVLGVAGVYIAATRYVVFSDMTDELRRDRRAIVRGIREVLKLLSSTRLPVNAGADPSIPKADAFLKRIGFTHVGGGLYEWLH